MFCDARAILCDINAHNQPHSAQFGTISPVLHFNPQTQAPDSMRAHQQRSPWAATAHNDTSLLAMREEKMTTQKVRARVAQAKPCVDTAAPKTMAMPHLSSRLKKMQLQDNRAQEIIRDNQNLLDKITTILQVGHGDGVCGTGTTSVLPPSPITSMTCAPISFSLLHRSKHARIRRQAGEKVLRENEVLLARLEEAKPFIDVIKMEDEYARRGAQRALHSKTAMRAKVQALLKLEEEEEERGERRAKKQTTRRALAMAW